MSLLAFKTQLAFFGLPLLDVPVFGDPSRPPVPEQQYPLLFVDVPVDQATLLLEADGLDPTWGLAVPVGGEARRLLMALKLAGKITAWHAFVGNNGSCGCHIQLNQTQAIEWYSLIDFVNQARLSTSDEDEVPVEFKNNDGDVVHIFN